MGPKETLLTTKEFASRSGLAVTQVTKLLREKKLAGEKQSGKWMIPESALPSAGGTSPEPQPKAKPPAKSVQTGRSVPAYSVSEFSAMTYLTEAGVTRWLKQGRLQGTQNPGGEWQVDAASLELPCVKHLLRP